MSDAILGLRPLGFVWDTTDPFLFCVHHLDAYPAGDAALGPAASLAGRQLGMDFEPRDGWRMYHGKKVPGFPSHPHRGFETVTILRSGYVDHADSLGATARFGPGDAQWLTAGEGIVHAEMFPLLRPDGPNTLELFQIWLNLPAADKMAPPHFAMLWSEQVPRHREVDARGRAAVVTVIAGALGDARPPAPPPRSWASRPESHLAIWHIQLEPGATWTLPPADAGVGRSLYAFRGPVRLGGRDVTPGHGARLRPEAALSLEAGPEGAELLLLQGRPIAEPVAQHGPFVMNTQAELQQAYADYRRTGFGGWPWPHAAPVHAREAGRFARRPDGAVERPASV